MTLQCIVVRKSQILRLRNKKLQSTSIIPVIQLILNVLECEMRVMTKILGEAETHMHPTNFPGTNSQPTNKAEARSVGSCPKRLTPILLPLPESHPIKAFDRGGRNLPGFKAFSFKPLSSFKVEFRSTSALWRCGRQDWLAPFSQGRVE